MYLNKLNQILYCVSNNIKLADLTEEEKILANRDITVLQWQKYILNTFSFFDVQEEIFVYNFIYWIKSGITFEQIECGICPQNFVVCKEALEENFDFTLINPKNFSKKEVIINTIADFINIKKPFSSFDKQLLASVCDNVIVYLANKHDWPTQIILYNLKLWIENDKNWSSDKEYYRLKLNHLITAVKINGDNLEMNSVNLYLKAFDVIK